MGAEVASTDLLTRLDEYSQINKVINFYGPTETTIYCSYAVLSERQKGAPETGRTSEIFRAEKVNIIGKPIWNVQIYILNARLRPVPIGVTGELHVGGNCLARGYLNQPELTAQRFIANPFSNYKDARLYKTGDIGRYLPDGSIEFMGRIDNQVQIRGLRVELQGIEAVLNQHTAVLESLVRVATDPSGEKHLVAYVVPLLQEDKYAPTARTTTTNHLRSYLEGKLPRYMIPLTFVLLDELPRNSRGKLEFDALPEPTLKPSGPKHPFVPPRTDLENALAQIWKEVLGVEEVSIRDHFLELGGNSLSAIRITNRVNAAFGTELNVRAIFDAPTVEDLTCVVSRSLHTESAFE
jgi:acyl-CoA synthetase (AMP-forming)/AMP-acid ligase II/acyl carrier protein